MQKISIANKEYNYSVRQSKKAKYIKLLINEQGLQLVLPVGVSSVEGERFLVKNSGWIEKNIGKYSYLTEDYFYLGRKISIEQNISVYEKYIKVEMPDSCILRITSAPGNNFSMKKVYELWLRRQAQKIIPARVKYLAEKHGFKTGRISVRNQKTRWGSCSNDGNLSFNFRLLLFEPAVIDYVIVHELCHLREMNHSKNFWNNVAGIIPEYKEIKNKLKRNNQ